MRRKILLITVLVLLLVFAVAPLISLPVGAEESAGKSELISLSVGAEESAGKSEVETINAQPAPTLTIFSDGFESGWNWGAYDADSGSGYDYWGRVDGGGYVRHTGTYSAWCAAVSDHPYGTWYYDNDMDAYMYRAVPSGYTSLTLSYWYWTQNEVTSGIQYDFLKVAYWYNGAWHPVASHGGSTSYTWKYNSVSIPSYAQYVGFNFYSDYSNANYYGSYVDDVVFTGNLATKVDTVLDFSLNPNPAVPYQDVTLSGTLKTTGGSAVPSATVTVTYSNDGGAHWYSLMTLTTNAAGQFTGSLHATGTGTFLIRASYAGSATYNPSSHIETLTVIAAANPTVEIWTHKTTYARGETLNAYIQGINPGPATTVKVNAWFIVPGYGTYGYETVHNGYVPGTYTTTVLWQSFTVPSNAPSGTYSINAEIRDPATNALIDSDTYYFTVT